MGRLGLKLLRQIILQNKRSIGLSFGGRSQFTGHPKTGDHFPSAIGVVETYDLCCNLRTTC